MLLQSRQISLGTSLSTALFFAENEETGEQANTLSLIHTKKKVHQIYTVELLLIK